MNIELSTNITAADSALLQQLYVDSFPADERRPWQTILSPQKPYGPILYSIIADGSIAGLVTLWLFDDFAYIEHLAVDPSQRRNGIGGKVIEDLRRRIGRRELVLEIEPPTPEQPDTVRRHSFYSRHGFATIDTDYIQPPYSEGLSEVHMHLMSTAPMAAKKVGRTLHKEVYGR